MAKFKVFVYNPIHFMNMVLNTLLFIFGTILVFNSVFTFILWYKSRDIILRHLLFFWLTGLTAFFMQGAFNNLTTSGFIAFSINALSAYFLISILYQTISSKLPIKFYLVCSIIGFSLSLFFMIQNFSFAIATAPFVGFVSLILLRAAYDTYKSKPDALQKGYILLILLTTFHLIDYPILRPREDMAVIGFSISLMIFFSYSIYIPLFITKKLSEKYTNNLENEVYNRTLKLNKLTEELQQANAKLGAHNQLLDQLAKENESLVHILVHDISNPVQVIAICHNKIKKPEITAAEKEKPLQKISIAIDTIFSIIRTVRSLNAIKNGKQDLVIADEDLNQMITAILQSFEIQLTEKQLVVEVDTPSSDLKVKTNIDIFKNQILANLISNSIKFSPNKSKIKLSIHPMDDCVILNIRDYGVGIPNELKNDLFSLNKKTSRIGTNGEKGTGFGLPLVKKYSQLINADVQLAEINDLLPGTCFQIKLPKAS